MDERGATGFALQGVDSAVLDGEAIVLRPDRTSDFEALRSPHGQAAAVLVAYDLMEVDGHDVRPETREERRTRLAKLLSRKNKTIRYGSSSARRSLETE